MKAAKITTDRHGHHEAIVASVAMSAGSEELFRIGWDDQRVNCCGRDLVVAAGQTVPVVDIQPHGLCGEVAQCGGCGSLHRAEYTARRVNRDELA